MNRVARVGCPIMVTGVVMLCDGANHLAFVQFASIRLWLRVNEVYALGTQSNDNLVGE